MKIRARSQAGFSLIEMALVIVLTSLFFSMITPSLMNTIIGLHFDQTRSNLVDSSRFAMDRLTAEVRQAVTIQDAGSHSLTFNNTEDQVTNASAEESNLILTVGENSAPLSSLLNSFDIVYYDDAGLPLNPSAENLAYIRSIRFRASFNPTRTFLSAAPFEMQTEVAPPNIASEERILP